MTTSPESAQPDIDPTLLEEPGDATSGITETESNADVTDAESDAGVDGAGDVTGDITNSDAEPDLASELAERTEDLQRLNAEYANYRRRVERERQAVVETAKAQVLTQLLPVLDDLELARQHGDLEEGPLKSIADKLAAVLTSQQLEPFGAAGDAFDPEIHEAVQDLSSGGEQVVGTVLRRGYRVGERLVRTAMVIIADQPDPEEPASASEAN